MRTLWVVVAVLAGLEQVAAQPGPSGSPGTAAQVMPGSAPGERDVLVAPGGGVFEVPVRIDSICILTFPGEQVMSAVKSSELFEVKAWNDDSVAVRALPKATRATLAIATKSGAIKVNVTLRVVGESEEALTLVRFRLSSAERATEQRISEEVERRLAVLRKGLDEEARRLEQTIDHRVQRAMLEAALARAEVVALRGHARSDRHVVVHVERVLWLGEEAYIFFELENRSREPYRLASAVVRQAGALVSGAARLRTDALDRPAELLGVVAPQTSALGVVVLHRAIKLRGKDLLLEVAEVAGRHKVSVTRGIVLP